MNKIKHFMLPEHTNRLYENEAISSISLTRDVADKINELVDAYNKLSEKDIIWKQEQEGRIRKGVVFMKDNLINSLHDLFELYLSNNDISKLVTNTMLNNDAKMLATLGTIVNVKNFGAVGDGVRDDTYEIKSAIQHAKEVGNCIVYFPRGVYRYTDLGNLAIDGLSIVGESGYKSTVLKCVNTEENHTALKFDAFENSTEQTPFCYGLRVSNIHVEGNEKTNVCVLIQGCAHSRFESIYAGECKSVVYDIRGVMTSAFYGVRTFTNNYKKIVTIPNHGCLIREGYRGGVDCGASTNNTFINCYFENCNVGLRVSRADQNTFTGCAMEYNEQNGIMLENNARMTLINACGIENNKVYDYSDSGRLTKMMNSYVQYEARMEGANCTIENCLIDAITISGLNNEVKNVRLKYHDYSDDEIGFVDNGIGTIATNIFNIKQAKNIFPKKKRKALTVSGSPFTYTNDTNHIVEVYVQAGTIGDAQLIQEGDKGVLLSPAVPAKYVVRPNDQLRFTYTATPEVSMIETYER